MFNSAWRNKAKIQGSVMKIRPRRRFGYRGDRLLASLISKRNISEAALVPVVAAVINPLPHHSVIGVQVDGDVLVLWVQHVAQLLQSTVLRAAAGGVAQVVHDVGHVHFTCNTPGRGTLLKMGSC